MFKFQREFYLTIFVLLTHKISETTQRAINSNLTPGEDRIYKEFPGAGAPFFDKLGLYDKIVLCPYIISPFPVLQGRACIGPPPIPFPSPVLPPPPVTEPPPPKTTSPPPTNDDEYGESAEEEEEEEVVIKYKPKRKKCNCRYHK